MKRVSVFKTKHFAKRIFGIVLAVTMVLTQCMIPMAVFAAEDDAVTVTKSCSNRVFFAESAEIPEGFNVVSGYSWNNRDNLFKSNSLVDGHKSIGALNYGMQEGKDLYFTTMVDVQEAGTYVIKTVGAATVAEDTANNWLSSVYVEVGGEARPTNSWVGVGVTNSYDATFASATSVLTTQAIYLTKGEHTITHKIGSRGGTADMYAFVLDFMDIVPLDTDVDNESTTVIPAAYLNPAAGYGKLLPVPDCEPEIDLGNGVKIKERIAVHSYAGPSQYAVSLDVKEDGVYNISYFVSPKSSWQSGANAWMDNNIASACVVQELPQTTLDYGWTTKGVGGGYYLKDFQPNRHVQTVELKKGTHTLNIEFESTGDFAVFTFDRIEIESANVPTLKDNVRIEAEYFDDWAIDDNLKMVDATNDGGLSANIAKEIDTSSNAADKAVIYTMYTMAETAGKYKLEIGAAAYNIINKVNWLNKVELLVNDVSFGYLGEGRAKLPSTDTYVVNGNYWYHKYVTNNPVSMNKGLNKIQFKAVGPAAYGAGFGLDYISGTTVTPSVTTDEKTRIFFDESSEYSDGFDITNAYDPTKLFTGDSFISGHKAMAACDFAAEKDLIFSTDVNVEKAGSYLIKTVGSVTAKGSKKHTWLSTCAVEVDGNELESNPVFSEDLVSPIKNNYFSAFADYTSVLTTQLVELTEGNHTISHKIGKEHAYAFALDFIDVIPVGMVESGKTTVIPAYYMNPANGLGASLVIPGQTLTTELTNESMAEEKLTAVHVYREGMVDYAVNISVPEDGIYDISYLVSAHDANWQSEAKAWIDNDESSMIGIQNLPKTTLDYAWTGNGTAGYALNAYQPNRYTQKVQLTKGSHKVNVKFENMADGYPVFTFDRIEIASVTVPVLEDGTKVEAEYFANWSTGDNTKLLTANNSSLSGSVAKEFETLTNGEGETMTYTMYVMSDEAKAYEMEIGASAYNSVTNLNWLSPVEMIVNGVSLGTLGGGIGTQLCKSPETTYAVDGNHWYYTFTPTAAINLKAGINEIQFKALPRVVDAGGFIFGLDYIRVWNSKVFDGEWTLELANSAVKLGETAKIVVKNGNNVITPADVYSMTFKATSTQDIHAAEVNGEGVITGLEAGDATIIVEIRVNPSDATTITREIDITVVDGDVYISDIDFSEGPISFKVNNMTEITYTEALVVVAGYDAYGRMLEAEILHKTLNANGFVDCITETDDLVMRADNIKIIVLNSWASLQPLLKSAKEL